MVRGTAADVDGSRAALCRPRCKPQVRHRKRKSARLVIGDLLFQDGVERKRADRTLARGLGSGLQGVV